MAKNSKKAIRQLKKENDKLKSFIQRPEILY